MRRLAALLAASSIVVLSAQAPSPLARAAQTITEADISRRVGIIADDSMLGRDTPSRGLELTAQYVADEFKRFGLKGGGDRGGWFQRYSIARRYMDLPGSNITFTAAGVGARADFTTSARFGQGVVPAGPIRGTAVLVGGRLTPEDVSKMALRNRVVLYVADFSRPIPENAGQIGRAIRLGAPKAIVLISNQDSAAFARSIPPRARERTVIGMDLPIAPAVEVHEAVLTSVLRATGASLRDVRSSQTPVFRDLSRLTVRLDLRDVVTSSVTAPNTVGILEGSDPKLKHEYVIYSAHMDHIGITRGLADSINNGADDDASGTAAVIELAEAFSRPGARPKRSVVFLAVSGEEKGLWGSRYFSEHPTVPIDGIVANINIDMIGRNWPDTIVAIGREHSDLGATVDRINAAHPELGLTAIDDPWPEERFYFRSDHYNFARKGVPILFFFSGAHEDYHGVGDSPEKINAEKEARIVRLLFYLGQEVGNAPARPEWRRESYDEIVETAITKPDAKVPLQPRAAGPAQTAAAESAALLRQ